FYDTFGIPLELIEELALDEGVTVDRDGFEKAMAAARERSKSAGKFDAAADAVPAAALDPSWTTEFLGYPEDDFVRIDGASVLGLFPIEKDGSARGPVPEAASGTEAWAISDKTVFYAEGGGQVADTGLWTWDGGKAEVLDTQKSAARPGLV